MFCSNKTNPQADRDCWKGVSQSTSKWTLVRFDWNMNSTLTKQSELQIALDFKIPNKLRVYKDTVTNYLVVCLCVYTVLFNGHMQLCFLIHFACLPLAQSDKNTVNWSIISKASAAVVLYTALTSLSLSFICSFSVSFVFHRSQADAKTPQHLKQMRREGGVSVEEQPSVCTVIMVLEQQLFSTVPRSLWRDELAVLLNQLCGVS